MNGAPFVSPTLSSDERLDRVNEHLWLIQKDGGLQYGTDAFLLAAYIRPFKYGKAVELGAGTGIVSLLLAARQKFAHITAVEIQPPYAQLIARNAEMNGLQSRITPLCRDVRELSAATLGGEADVVFSNPPYMRCDSGKRNQNDEKYIARHEVCGGIDDFCLSAKRLLRFGGKFVCVWRPDRLSELFRAMHNATLEPKRMTLVYADETAEPCMLLAEAVKGGAPSMRLSPPLLLYRLRTENSQTRTLAPQAQKIYDTCSFDA